MYCSVLLIPAYHLFSIQHNWIYAHTVYSLRALSKRMLCLLGSTHEKIFTLIYTQLSTDLPSCFRGFVFHAHS